MAALQTVKQTSREQQVVQVKCRGTELSVVDAKDEQLLACSLLSVAQCVQETTHGFSDCIAVVFSSGAWAGQCHVFQAKSPREVCTVTGANGRMVYWDRVSQPTQLLLLAMYGSLIALS